LRFLSVNAARLSKVAGRFAGTQDASILSDEPSMAAGRKNRSQPGVAIEFRKTVPGWIGMVAITQRCRIRKLAVEGAKRDAIMQGIATCLLSPLGEISWSPELRGR